MFRRILTLLAMMALLAVAACESSEDKAERFYRSGLTLLAEGDVDRAAVEFRNVLRYDDGHEDARWQLANILRDQGEISAAYGQFLQLAEQFPDRADARQTLARIAIAQQNWDEAERHGRKAIELDPNAGVAKSIKVSLDYRQAAIDEDFARRTSLAAEARALLQEDPQDIMSRRVLIAEEMAQNRPSAALEHIDVAIAQFPEDMTYYVVKLQALSALRDEVEIEALLKQMFVQFPENQNVQQSLISFYMQRGDTSGAEAFLRELAGDDTGDPEGFVPVIELITRANGVDAAKAEIQRLIAANADVPENRNLYRAMLASFAFDEGRTDEAITDMQDIVARSEASDQTRRIKGSLATMLLRTGNQVGGRALIEEILAEDAAHVTALKLRAELLINADQPGDAIVDLRRALDQSPRDTSILLLLARAHERNGNAALQGERLATAVDVSNGGVQESLLYADFLLRDGRTGAARTVLADARNANPTNLDILAQSAQLALTDNALGVVRGIIADVERLQDQPRASALLQSLRTALLLREDRVEEGLRLLQQQAGDTGENGRAVFAVVQTHLRAGELEEARLYLDGLLEANPDDPVLQLIHSGLLVSEGETDRAETVLRQMLERDPQSEAASSQLYILLRSLGKTEEATALLDSALQNAPDAPRLLVFKAGELEVAGDIDGAIRIYEDMYAVNSNNVMIANNLASLLSSFRDDEETQARAAAVARRLRGTEVPAFQDTYGWIAYQQGEFEEALAYLEPAAESLPDNALVQFHLGMTYVALDRPDDARRTLERAIEVGGPDSTLPQMQQARDVLDSL